MLAIHHRDDYDPSVGPEAMSKIRIEDPLFSSILPGVADFIGELGNAHFSFRQHDLDVNDDCHIRLDSQVVLSDFISTAFCKIRSNTAAAVAMMAETKIMKAPIMTPPAISSLPRMKMDK